MQEFDQENYKPFTDVNNVMSELFGITCSLCAFEEISYVSSNAPKPLGLIAREALDENDELTDDEMDHLMTSPVEAWQEVDDYNAKNGVPTFLCFDCYEQLSNGDIKVSDILTGDE